MRAYVRSLLPIASIAMTGLACPAEAQLNGLLLPQAPTGAGGEDSIETSSGTRCRQSINSSGAYLDMGAVASSATAPRPDQRAFLATEPEGEAIAYARVTIPLGRRPKRIDCTAVYELELAKLRQEVELLRISAR